MRIPDERISRMRDRLIPTGIPDVQRSKEYDIYLWLAGAVKRAITDVGGDATAEIIAVILQDEGMAR